MQVTPSAALRAIKRAVYRPRTLSPRAEKRIVDRFHKLYFYGKERTWKNNTFWLDVPVAKSPLDLWIYQEIIYETKPDIIIETGTAYGGSALFLCSICDLLNCGRIITVDVRELPDRPQHERLKYLIGSSTSDEIVQQVRRLTKPGDRVMVILDSDHTAGHVLQELHLYGNLVTVGCYLIVEDTNINGHPVMPLYGEGPMEALEQFRRTQKNFFVDREREKFFMTFNPKGYLRRVW
ncbi:MAG: cephalosporin hydroxylase family protein [Acidobacteriota bacterium]|nr:cephalosporin hydroxylase family protein [Acidobacteriota bacterium]